LLVAFATARNARLGSCVRTQGVGGERALAYTSDQDHFSVARAIDLLGFGTAQLRRIAVDEQLRLRPRELEAQIEEDRAAGGRPWLVVAQGGSVGTGAVDPLDDLADICQRHGLWLHVDAAYGGPAASLASVSHLFRGLDRADSVSVDPHKWLYTSYECGCVLTRARGVLEDAFAPEGASYVAADLATDAPDFMKRGLDHSRGFRALKVWATFVGLGTETLRLAISQDIALARHLANLVSRHPEFELAAQTSLSIATFRFVPSAGLNVAYVDALNARIPHELRRDGRIYMGSLRLRDRTVLRACIVNHRVTDRDVDDWITIVAECGRRLHETQGEWWTGS
jgi:aromatic-L-amino-acid/L-tryptophan decarboxylase